MENKLNEILLDKLKDYSDPKAIKNFVLADNSQIPDESLFDQSFIFDGIVFMICVKGSCTIKINYREYHVGKGSFLTILPRHIFKMVSKSDDYLTEMLFLSPGFIDTFKLPTDIDLLIQIGHQPCLAVTKENMHHMLEFHSLIVKYYHNTEIALREYMVKSLLYSLLLLIGSLYIREGADKAPQKWSRQQELTESFFKLLMQHYKKERSVAFYADKLCLTPKYLSVLVKNVTGRSILEWINKAVIIEIKTLLKTTDRTILQISEELNFANPSFFGRFFKQYTGMTPLKFRNSTEQL